MISSEQARTLAQASHASYGDSPIPTGYELVQASISLNDPNTGFNAEIYRRNIKGQVYILHKLTIL